MTCMDDVSRMVARQYEAYAYPAPFTDLAARLAEGYFEYGNPADYAALLWPEGRPRRPLSILAAGCGTVQAAFDVPGAADVSLQKDGAVAERQGSFALCFFEAGREVLRVVHHPHSSTAASEGCLDDQWETDFGRRLPRSLRTCQRLIGSRNNRDTGPLRKFASFRLVTQ